MATLQLIQDDADLIASGRARHRSDLETTRYLCAAVYTDAALRRAVIARSRPTLCAHAPELGIDVGVVEEHARRASRKKAVRDLLLLLPAAALLYVAIVAIAAEDPAGAPIGLAMLCWLAATIVVAVDLFSTNRILHRELDRDAFAQEFAGGLPNEGNVIVYSGFSPFVGSGWNMGGWSFAIDLSRGKPGLVANMPQPFELKDLYAHLAGAFRALHLPGVRITRKLFVSGRSVRREPDLLPDIYEQPATFVDDAALQAYSENKSQCVRHYLNIVSSDWDGELVVSLFVRVTRLSSKMFVEFNALLLPPLKERFYELDRHGPDSGFAEAIQTIIAAAIRAPFQAIYAPFAFWGRVQERMGKYRKLSQEKDLARKDRLFDYGARKSIREQATGTDWRVYFQKLDKEMHSKILQQHLLDTLVDYLDERGVDTSDIKERVTQILNNGVIVSGGSINAEGMAVGDGAVANVTNAARKARAKVPA